MVTSYKTEATLHIYLWYSNYVLFISKRKGTCSALFTLLYIFLHKNPPKITEKDGYNVSKKNQFTYIHALSKISIVRKDKLKNRTVVFSVTHKT